MTNNLPLPLSTLDVNVENLTILHRHPLVHSNDPLTSVSQNFDQKPSSSYLTLSVGDHRHFGSSNFQDPLFFQQPLPLYYNQPMPSTTGSGHETGDRARLTNEITFNEYRKQKSVSSRQHRIDKSKSTHRRYTNSKKSKEKMIKEKEKKVSRRNMNKRKHKSRKINRNTTQQLRYQVDFSKSKYNQALLLKRRRRQQMLLKKKKKLLKQHMAPKKRSLSNVNKAKSFTSSQHARKINTTNNRVTSTVLPRRSSTSKLTRTRSITQSKTETTGSRPSSMIQRTNNPKRPTVSNKLKHRTDISTLKPVSQSTSRQMMNVTIAPMNTNNENLIKSMDINNDNIRTKTSSSLVSLRTSSSKKQLSTSTAMPLTKTSAQLTSKNNNRCTLKMKCQGSSLISRILEGKLKGSTRRGMTLRSRTIIINNDNSTERKERKYKRNHRI